jgi:hypothetical protein
MNYALPVCSMHLIACISSRIASDDLSYLGMDLLACRIRDGIITNLVGELYYDQNRHTQAHK